MPYLNLDTAEYYPGKCWGFFIGDFCVVGLRFTVRSGYYNFGIVICQIGAGFFHD